MTNNPTILITRPEPQASRFAVACRDRFGGRAVAVVAPLLVAEFGGDEIEGVKFSAAIFTSETGVTGAARLWKGPRNRAFAVGDRTAEAARALGWKCESANGNGSDLAELLIENAGGAPMVWARGAHVASNLMEQATARGVAIVARQVYRQVEQTLPVHAKALANRSNFVLLPLFSPRSAKIAQTAIADLSAEVIPFAISNAAAAAFGGETPIRVAAHPTSASMLDALSEIFRELDA